MPSIAVGARRRGAEFVVEDLERDRPVVAARQHVAHEACHRERALAREAAEVPAPRQRIEPHQWRIGELGEEDAVARNACDRRIIVVDREGVEAVDHEADRRMVGGLHQLPGTAELVDVAPPRQRLVADAEAASRRTFAERAQVGGRDAVVVDRIGRDVAADQHQVGAELLHHVELRLGAIEVLRHARARRRLEVAERLEQQDAQAEVGRDAPHFGGRAVEIHQVVLEDLDAVEPRGRDRGELFHQRAAERDRGDRAKHFGWPYKNEFVGDS
jgi:hypothetical protein